jgi:hypothetical protein
METSGIEELLSETPAEEAPVVETPETAETPEPEAKADERPRNPDGTFAPKQTGEEAEETTAEATPANPVPEDDFKSSDQFKGYLTEKRKRQELEQTVAEMRAQFEALQAQSRSAQPPEQPVDFWDDPQRVIATQVQQAVVQALAAEKQQQTMERINASETAAKVKYADYDDAFRAFQQAASANPTLIQQMTAASDPAEFAYTKGKTALQLEQVGSIDELLKAERAKWEAELKAAVPPAPAQSFPATTATDGSVGARSGPGFVVPTIDQLLS